MLQEKDNHSQEMQGALFDEFEEHVFPYNFGEGSPEDKQAIDDMLAGFDGPERKKFLLDFLYHYWERNIDKAIEIWTEQGVREILEGVGEMNPEEFMSPDAGGRPRGVDEQATRINSMIGCSWFSKSSDTDPSVGWFTGYPFEEDLKDISPDHSRLAAIMSIVSHEMALNPALGAFTRVNFGGLEECHRGTAELAVAVYPRLYQAGLYTLEGLKYINQDDLPMGPVDLNKVLEVLAAQTAVYFFMGRALSGHTESIRINWNGTEYVNGSKYDLDKTERKLRLTASFAPDMAVEGNGAALNTVLWQFVKNSLKQLNERARDGIDPEINIQAAPVELETAGGSQKMLAIRFSDNGPGLDIKRIIEATQKIIRQKKDEGSPLDEQEAIVDDEWAILDLSYGELVDLIFKMRVSGAGQGGSGIGLAVAKKVIDQHGGCIWAANLKEGQGVKFLILLDGNPEGDLRRNFPELFRTEAGRRAGYKTPAALLHQIEEKMEQSLAN